MTFTNKDADLWYMRNKAKFLDKDTDPIMMAIRRIEKPGSVFEFGCADGHRLQWIRDEMDSIVKGIDISSDAISAGRQKYPHVGLKCCPIDNHRPLWAYDLIIFGFCLYLINPKDLFQITAMADMMLKDGGHIIIWDYHHDGHLFRPYRHCEGVTEHHMDFAKIFSWHPWYKNIGYEGAPEGPVITLKKEINETTR